MPKVSPQSPPEWEITTETKSVLRILKSALHYCDAVGRFCLGVSQIGPSIGPSSDIFTGSVNLYYSLFHLGAGALKLMPEHRFDVGAEFVFPNGANWNEIRKSRLGLRHKDAIAELGRLGQHYPYLKEIGGNLERWKDIRELFSYGAVPQLTSIKTSNPEQPIPEFATQSIFLGGDLQSIPQHPEPFLLLKDEVAIMVPTVEKLVNQFPQFFLQLINVQKFYEPYMVKSVLSKALFYAPFFFGPYVPELVFEETKVKLRDWLGAGFREVTEPVSEHWNSATYSEAARAGWKISIKGKLERKAVCVHCGTPLSDFSKPCPGCGASFTRWTS